MSPWQAFPDTEVSHYIFYLPSMQIRPTNCNSPTTLRSIRFPKQQRPPRSKLSHVTVFHLLLSLLLLPRRSFFPSIRSPLLLPVISFLPPLLLLPLPSKCFSCHSYYVFYFSMSSSSYRPTFSLQSIKQVAQKIIRTRNIPI